jgi:tetratricopeptide (TPR) repeat protein
MNGKYRQRNSISRTGRASTSKGKSTSLRLRQAVVQVRVASHILPTYLPAAPDKNPMFLEKRVYQGSSGKVYPLPFTDRIAEKPVEREWKAIWIENEFLRVLVLPEIGGRIHAIQDKTNGYDLIYNQPVIKPALVGLAGPWISGGIEFNWPQHHRPATFLPVNYEIEKHADGSVTVWCSDHDPMCRMKGMHGVSLHPGKAYVELKVRAYNRTPFAQTFLWWANVATRVHEAYQSFFPPDVYCVADHARRSMSEYPLAQGHYYGVNYGERGRKGVPVSEIPAQFIPAHCDKDSALRTSRSALPSYAPNDLSFYANIPVPTSYMCMESQEDFFGGYDHAAQAGLIHVANHHIAPGKKQWTWGNHEFGYAWDRNLTERAANGAFAPYIEIMAGVYTDNQPDFSFLQPGETKTWSQYWYPIQQIGPAQHANLDAAVSLRRSADLQIGQSRKSRRTEPIRRSALLCLGVSVTKKFTDAKIVLRAKNKTLFQTTRDLAPGTPLVKSIRLPRGVAETDLLLRVADSAGHEIISYQPKPRIKGDVPPPATEPPAPADIASADELFTTGLHLEQYRHATRCPALYWREALRRDPLDARCNNALGRWHLKRGEFAIAEKHFRKSIERLTRRNANPADGEPFYHLGLTLRQLGRDVEAYAVFYKATWNQAWAAAGYHALAEIDGLRRDWSTALDHLNRSLRFDTDNLRARNLKIIVLRKLNRTTEAAALLRETLVLDPLDWWARHLRGDALQCDLQTALDLAHDFTRIGLFAEAITLLQSVAPPITTNDSGKFIAPATELPDQSWGAIPLVHYTLGWLEEKRRDQKASRQHFRTAAALPPDYCFPARLEEIGILETAMRVNSQDARAPYYLGNLLYDRRRHDEAIRLWERSAKLDPKFSVVWRNLGIAYFNIRRQPAKARAAYDKAFKVNPADARLLFERDQLWKRLGETPAKRLRKLEQRLDLVQQRDDLSVELCALYNQIGAHEKALALVSSRHFQPWEGGEGGPFSQWVRSHLALGRAALTAPIQSALFHFQAALTAPANLGEAKHLLANQSDIHYWLGCALAELGDVKQARQHWRAAATFKGDFQEMSVRAFSEMTYYSALAWGKLGQAAKAKKLLRELAAYAEKLQRTPAKIDYFATSLPTMLLFEDDLQFRQETTAMFLQAQAQLGLGHHEQAEKLLAVVLKRDPNHALAADLQSETQRHAGSKQPSLPKTIPALPVVHRNGNGATSSESSQGGVLSDLNQAMTATDQPAAESAGVVSPVTRNKRI